MAKKQHIHPSDQLIFAFSGALWTCHLRSEGGEAAIVGKPEGYFSFDECVRVAKDRYEIKT